MSIFFGTFLCRPCSSTTTCNLLTQRFIDDKPTTTSFCLFFLLFFNLSAGSKNSTPGKFAFWHLKRVGINATKFEKKREYIFSSQFFAAVLNKLRGGRMQREINEAREKGGRHVRKR